MNLIIKEYKSGDEIEIIKLFKEVFNKEMTLSYWKWRYGKSKEKYISLMWDNEKLVGHYALFPIEVYIGNELIKTGFSMTTMTSEHYKNLGIFKTLANKLYSYSKLNLIWGFPNNNSLHGFTKYLNWNHIFDIDMLVIDLKNINCGIKVSENILSVNKCTSDVNELLKKVVLYCNYTIITNRSYEYLNWRYVYNPIHKYYILEYRENNILKGYCIYKMYLLSDNMYGDIVDILCINRIIFKQLIKAAIRNIKINGGEYANIWMIKDEFVSILIDIGFRYGNNITHFGICVNPDKVFSDYALNIKNWYLTMGDSDVF